MVDKSYPSLFLLCIRVPMLAFQFMHILPNKNTGAPRRKPQVLRMGEHPAELSTITTSPQPHVLIVSFPGQGHVNPLLRLAKRIASHGPLVTFSSSASIGRKITTSTNSTADTLIPVGRGYLRFEFFPDGINPDGPEPQIDTLMEAIHTAWPGAVADLVHRHADAGRPISCIINNPFIPWVLDVAVDLNIPCAVLWVQSCAVFSTYYHFHHTSGANFPTDENPNVIVRLPGLPDLCPEDIPTFLLPSSPYVSLREAILEQFHNLDKATWVFANTFTELEREAIEAIQKLPVPIIPVGPLVDFAQSGPKGDLMKAADCMEWLDAQQPQSVVYVSVGSVVVLSREEMGEIAHVLKNGGRPYIWVVRQDCRELLPEGFEEGDGRVVGWAPQEAVLSHTSTACFVTHCGWNSTLEALAAGVPVVALPQWGDQVTDAKFLSEIYGVGVWAKGAVRREELARCVEAVTAGEAAEDMRRRAAQWKEAAREAVAPGGSSDRNIQEFVDKIRRGFRGSNEIAAEVGFVSEAEK